MNSFGNNFLNLGNKKLAFFCLRFPMELAGCREKVPFQFALFSVLSLSSSSSLSGKYMEHSVSSSALASDVA